MKQTPDTPDPAMTAFVELKAAEAALTETERLVDAEALDDKAPEVEAVRKRDIDALERFADTEPTTVRGVITKLQYFVDNGDNDIDVRNVRAVIAYLEKAAKSGNEVAEPSKVTHDYKKIVFGMEGPIGEAKLCADGMRKLIDFVDAWNFSTDRKDRPEQDLKNIMFNVQEDLDSALQQIHDDYYKLFEATPDAAFTDTQTNQ